MNLYQILKRSSLFQYFQVTRYYLYHASYYIVIKNAQMCAVEAEECDACSGHSHGAGKRPEG